MFTIRKATTEDCALIRKLAQQVFPNTYRDILTPEQIDYMMEWMYSEKNIRKQMEEEGHVYLLAYEECEAVGYVSVRPEGKDLFHLEKIYVLPYFQGAHCGSFLFHEAIRYIKEQLPNGTEREPPQQGVALLRAHGHEESARRRFPHREWVLYERLHHGDNHLNIRIRGLIPHVAKGTKSG